MSKKTKETKKQIIEAKFRNKEQLAQARIALAKSMKELETKVKQANLESRKLKLQLKKEAAEDKEKELKTQKELTVQLKKEKALVENNKAQIAAEKKRLNEELKLLKKQQANKLLKAKRENANAISSLKNEIAHEKAEQRRKLQETKLEVSKSILETKEEVQKAQNEAIKFRLENEKMIAAKKEELEAKKKDYNAKKHELKTQKQQDRAARIQEKIRTEEELRQMIQVERAKYNSTVLKIKGKAIEEKAIKLDQLSEQVEDLNKTKKELAKHKNAKLEQKAHETIQEIKLNSQVEEKEVEKVDFDDQNISGLTVEVDTTDFMPNIEDSAIRGKIIDEVGKVGLKLFEKANKDDTKLSLNKIKLPTEKIEQIKLIQELKKDKNLIDFREFAKYISYLIGKEVSVADVEKYVASSVYALLRGKTISFLGGYFRLEKVKKHSFIAFDKKLITQKHSLVSLPNSEFVTILEKMVLEKLNRGGVAQITNNLAVRVAKNTIEVLCDLPFLEV